MINVPPENRRFTRGMLVVITRPLPTSHQVDLHRLHCVDAPFEFIALDAITNLIGEVQENLTLITVFIFHINKLAKFLRSELELLRSK